MCSPQSRPTFVQSPVFLSQNVVRAPGRTGHVRAVLCFSSLTLTSWQPRVTKNSMNCVVLSARSNSNSVFVLIFIELRKKTQDDPCMPSSFFEFEPPFSLVFGCENNLRSKLKEALVKEHFFGNFSPHKMCRATVFVALLRHYFTSRAFCWKPLVQARSGGFFPATAKT